jgi:hypothetical protein
MNNILKNIWDRLGERWFDYREIRWFFQRMLYGYSDEDLWNLDYFLADLIQRSLKSFKNDANYSHPGSMTKEEWDAELDIMIKGFTDVQAYLDDCYDNDEEKAVLIESFDKGMKSFHKNFFSLWT